MTKFLLGRLVATPNALSKVSHGDILSAVGRHVRCDWGELCADDIEVNNQALVDGTRLLSAYRSVRGIKFWIITEADRSATTILLPEDY